MLNMDFMRMTDGELKAFFRGYETATRVHKLPRLDVVIEFAKVNRALAEITKPTKPKTKKKKGK